MKKPNEIHEPRMKRTKISPKAKKFPPNYTIPPKIMETAVNVACKIAWSFHNTTRTPVEELISEAKLAAMEGLLDYDNNKASHISTYIYVRVTNRLIAFVNIEGRYWRPDVEDYDFDQFAQQPCFNIDLDFSEDMIIKNKLNEAGKRIAEIAENNKMKLAGMPPKMMRGVIVKLLREEGWSWPKIWMNIQELKKTLNETTQNCIT